MQALYYFDFLASVSRDLMEKLDSMDESPLDPSALSALRSFQVSNGSRHGVYVIHYVGKPVYVGKAIALAARLGQHLKKLTGRRNITLSQVGYKALFLDKSMGTGANETLLIKKFEQHHSEMWNGGGFGPKDPGINRDTTKPGPFDIAYPIIDDYPLEINTDATGQIPLHDLMSTMKEQLPFVFRFELPLLDRTKIVTLGPVRNAIVTTQEIVSFLGQGWQAGILSYGIVIYRSNRDYPYGKRLFP